MRSLRRNTVRERLLARCWLDSTPTGCPAVASIAERGELLADLGLDVPGICAAVRHGLGRGEAAPAAQRVGR
jgi:hypothetical protein